MRHLIVLLLHRRGICLLSVSWPIINGGVFMATQHSYSDFRVVPAMYSKRTTREKQTLNLLLHALPPFPITRQCDLSAIHHQPFSLSYLGNDDSPVAPHSAYTSAPKPPPVPYLLSLPPPPFSLPVFFFSAAGCGLAGPYIRSPTTHDIGQVSAALAVSSLGAV